MFKNKDGSYNKVSIILTACIALIIIGMIGSSLLQVSEVPSTDIPLALIIITIIGMASFMLYRWMSAKKISKPTVSDTPQTSVKKIFPPDTPTKLIEPTINDTPRTPVKKIFHDTPTKLIKPTTSINIVSLVMTVMVAGVTMVIGSTVLTSLMSAMPTIPETSDFAVKQTEIISNVSTAFNLLSLGFVVGAAGLIILFLGRMVGNDN